MKKLDITGVRYGSLVAVSPAEKSSRGQAVWLCNCDCGLQKEIRLSSLRSGESLSCGCRKLLSNEDTTTHGLSQTAEYKAWTAMKGRCGDPSHSSYKNYGARGISVCQEWITFEGFISSMGMKPDPSLTLERRNNNGNYEPSNCYWATRSQQNSNKRSGR